MSIKEFFETKVAIYNSDLKNPNKTVNLLPVETTNRTRKDMGNQSPIFRYYEKPKLKVSMRLRSDADPYDMKKKGYVIEDNGEIDATIYYAQSGDYGNWAFKDFSGLRYNATDKTPKIYSSSQWCPHFDFSHFDIISWEILPVAINETKHEYC